MYNLNTKIKDLEPYEPIKGDYKIRLDANESYMNLPEDVLEEIKEELFKLGFNRYPDPLALDLCNAFGKLYNIKTENIVAGNGSDELIALLFSGFVMKGEAFATFENDFSMYKFYGSLSECTSVTIPKEENFKINVKNAIKICKNEKIRLLIFSNPCNPTSLGITIEDVKEILNELPNTMVVVDEAYMDFWNESVLDEIENYDNLLILKTCSKALGLASMRVGFAIGNTKLINAIKAIKSPYNMDSFSQAIGRIVLSHEDLCKNCTAQIVKATKEFYSMLEPIAMKNGMEILKPVTNFVVLRTEKANEIYKFLLKKGIAVRCFKGFLRICAGTDEEMQETAKCIEEFFN